MTPPLKFKLPPRRKARLLDLNVSRVDLVPAGANPESHVLLAKANSATNPALKERNMPNLDALADLTDDEVAGIGQYVTDLADALAAAETRAADAAAALAKATAEADDDADLGDDVLKGLPTAAADLIRKAQADAAAARSEAEAVTKAERTRVFKATAAALVNLSGGDDGADRLGAVLDEVEKAVTPETYAELERTLVAADAQITKGDLFKSKGSDASDSSAPNLDVIKARTEELVAAGDDFLIASRKARAEHPDAVDAYMASVRTGASPTA